MYESEKTQFLRKSTDSFRKNLQSNLTAESVQFYDFLPSFTIALFLCNLTGFKAYLLAF